MSYRDLVDVALTVDTSGLQGTLERIDNNVEILQGKINEIVTLTEEDVQTLIRDALGDGSPGVDALGDLVQRVSELEKTEWTEDTLHDEIASYISAENIMDSDDVDRAIDDKLDGYVASDDLSQQIEDVLDNKDYVTEDDVRELAHNEGVLQEDSAPFTELVQRVEALEGEDNESIDGLKQRVIALEVALENGNFASDSTVEDLGERVNALEQADDGDDNRIGSLASLIGSLTEQVKAQDSAIDSQLARLEDLEKRADDEKSIESLAERMAQQDARIDTLLAHIEQLTLKMGETLERSDTALTFFGLIKQAFALLQRG